MHYTCQHGIVSEKTYADGDLVLAIAGQEGWMSFGLADKESAIWPATHMPQRTRSVKYMYFDRFA